MIKHMFTSVYLCFKINWLFLVRCYGNQFRAYNIDCKKQARRVIVFISFLSAYFHRCAVPGRFKIIIG